MNLQAKIQEFFDRQMRDWQLARENVEALERVRTRRFDFGEFEVRAQFNPARAVSSGAKLDKATLEARPCFLCPQNRPPEQRSLRYNERFELCINPFPILRNHLTVAATEHLPQEFLPYYMDMLSLAEDLPNYLTFYNGARSGASAPDHLHFQAGLRAQLPLEDDLSRLPRRLLHEAEGAKIFSVDNYLRVCFVIEADRKEAAREAVEWLMKGSGLQSEPVEEAMMNVFCGYDNGRWTTVVFPRLLHRPAQYFAEGETRMMISPGAIDMAGLLILPQERDFERLTADTVADVFRQVSF